MSANALGGLNIGLFRQIVGYITNIGNAGQLQASLACLCIAGPQPRINLTEYVGTHRLRRIPVQPCPGQRLSGMHRNRIAEWIVGFNPENARGVWIKGDRLPRTLHLLPWRVTNAGTDRAPPFSVGFYLSADASMDGGDKRLGGTKLDGLEPGATFESARLALIPSTLPAGGAHGRQDCGPWRWP